ncbi:acyl--CoA ligase [Oxalobacteraceae bacterium]|nr:acyl--CoA ligase [Oxalobacteraceae bacterium]
MLLDKLDAVAAAHRERIAIVSEQRQISYADLCAQARACAAALDALATLDAGATLGLCIHQPIDFMAAYLGAAGANRRIVLLDPRLKPGDLRALTHAGDVTHLLYSAAELTPASAASQAIAAGSGVAASSGAASPLQVAPLLDDWRSGDCHYLAGDFVVHTSSGSMGLPKAIVCTQEQIWHRIVSWIDTVDLTETDVTLCTLTLSHCHGIDMLMLPQLYAGGKVVAPDLTRLTPRRIVGLWADQRVTIFSSLPYMYELILDTVARDKVKLDSLRYIISASAPLSDETAIRFRESFGRSLNQGYGMSEIGCILLLKEQGAALGCAGDYVAAVEGRVLDDDGRQIGAGAAGTGELVVRGPGMARGYLKSPEAEQLMFRDGWLWTQDLVAHDPHGFAIKGRKSRFINVGGNKVDPAEVEQACGSHPQVQEAAVLGLQDARFGERIVAVIQARGEAPSASTMHTYLAASLAGHKLPTHYLFVDTIPRTGLGKVQLDALRRLAEQAAAPTNAAPARA